MDKNRIKLTRAALDNMPIMSDPLVNTTGQTISTSTRALSLNQKSLSGTIRLHQDSISQPGPFMRMKYSDEEISLIDQVDKVVATWERCRSTDVPIVEFVSASSYQHQATRRVTSWNDKPDRHASSTGSRSYARWKPRERTRSRNRHENRNRDRDCYKNRFEDDRKRYNGHRKTNWSSQKTRSLDCTYTPRQKISNSTATCTPVNSSTLVSILATPTSSMKDIESSLEDDRDFPLPENCDP
jgi:hypothetical protein